MTDAQIQQAELTARKLAHGCPVYAPPQSVDPSIATYNATRSGATSAACGQRWMQARAALTDRGLTPLDATQ